MMKAVHHYEGTVNERSARRRHHGALRRPSHQRGPRTASMLRRACRKFGVVWLAIQMRSVVVPAL
jgi:hypothetical protein